MTHTRTAIAVTAACCAAGLVAPAPARADGGPIAPVQGGPGVGLPSGSTRYIALDVRHGTLVVRMRDGSASRWRVVPPRYGVPGVAWDGSTTGLSADGRTLVLAAFPRRYPPRRSSLLVVDARRLHLRDRIALRGAFTVDAISPSGRWLYLIHYMHPGNYQRYEVRAYDLRHHRLTARPVVDPREPGEAMLGFAMTRATSTDGRWAYTLYQRPAGAPFIHALDTQGRTAACVDLDALSGTDVNGMQLVVPSDGGPLRLEGPNGVVARVDRRTFAVSGPPRPATGRRDVAARARSGPPWAGAAGGLVALAGLALLAAARRRYACSAIFRKAS